MQYRPEVDGLRTVAVIPVILFHAGFQLFSGGFVGVDIFFVISGYLITSIIYAELMLGKFSIVNFYERRARRILPALFFVLAACLPFAWLWLPPADTKGFAQSVVSVTLFSSNILFWLTGGYFDTATELKPLLHTWSLAVEEQYYVFFPLLLMLVWRAGKRVLLAVLAAIGLASLVAAQMLVHDKPDFTFYLLPTRAWELLIGAFTAIYFTTSIDAQVSDRMRQLGSLAGLALIAFSLFVYDKNTPFPSVYALAPTVGAALIILYARPATWVGRLLASKPFVGIGVVSYSAYLWHQPLFAFARHRSLDEPSPALLAALVAAVLALACFSWKYVEAPFRTRRVVARKQVFTFGLAGSMLFTAAGLSGQFTHGFLEQRTTPEQLAVLKTAHPSPKRETCHTEGKDYRKPEAACEYLAGKLTWAAYGDSHAIELAYAVAEKLQPQGIKLKHFSFSGCAPSFGTMLEEMPHCSEWTQEAAHYIGQHPEIETVVVSHRINAHLFGVHELTYPHLPHDFSAAQQEQRWTALVDVLRYFIGSGKQVILVLQAPELARPMDKLLFRATDPRSDVVSVRRAWWDARSAWTNARLSQIPREARIVDPAKVLCDNSNCYAARGGAAYYFDDNHLSVAGAELVADQVLQAAQTFTRHASR
ncbi:acyltransferase family protein [Duganella sp. FT92W]|uniref:Acyltransferase family protein n=1 Tax=Pseudoduganella rivuli TaxID=2666085 RepID=A0A7X2LRQ2_9BURK|nr:acyltransferase family protein [Pseudoduganella rivuli]MRV71058.1 acyltransferase family protein [Pseudoduganella rivuli]